MAFVSLPSCLRTVETQYKGSYNKPTGVTDSHILVERHVTDDGLGGMGAGGQAGAIAGQVVSVTALHKYTESSWDDGAKDWTETEVDESFVAGSLSISYAVAGEQQPTQQQIIAAPNLTFDIFPTILDDIAPGTLRFRLQPTGVLYEDVGGQGNLYIGDGAQAGTLAGTVDYAAKRIEIHTWTGAPTSLQLLSCITVRGSYSTTDFAFRAPGRPLVPAQLLLQATQTDGVLVQAQADQQGDLVATGVTGTVDEDLGLIRVTFDNPVFPHSVRISGVVRVSIPLSEAQIGIDPSPFPPDGLVPILYEGEAVVIHETDETTMPDPLTGAQLINTGVAKLAWVRILDGTGEQFEVLPTGLIPDQQIQLLAARPVGHRVLDYARVLDAAGRHVSGALYDVNLDTALITLAGNYSGAGYEEPFRAYFLRRLAETEYTVDLVAGTITMDPALDLAADGYTEPLVRRIRWEDDKVVADVQTNGKLRLQVDIEHDYSVAAKVSGRASFGTKRAQVTELFSQATWTGEWKDTVIGTPPNWSYDNLAHPIVLTNRGAYAGRYALFFKDSNGNFDLLAERNGQTLTIASGSTGADFNPTNPLTGEPYFYLWAAGWAGSPANGSCLRINFGDSAAGFWVLQTVLAGIPTVADTTYGVETRMDGD